MGPHTLVVAYLPHLAVTSLVLPGLWRVPETVSHEKNSGPGLLSRLRVPRAGHPRFLTVVQPLAP